MSRIRNSFLRLTLAVVTACLGVVLSSPSTALASGTFVELPSACECHGNKIGWYGTREFDLASPRSSTLGLTEPFSFAAGTDQAAVQDVWSEHGGVHDSRGFCRLDGCYLVACTSYFGNVGDVITFEFGDGSTIDCVKIDVKAEGVSPWDPTPASKYGHDNCQCALEFCGEGRIGDEPLSTLGKTNLGVTGYTNHGMHPDVAAKVGSGGRPTADMSSLGSEAAAGLLPLSHDCLVRAVDAQLGGPWQGNACVEGTRVGVAVYSGRRSLADISANAQTSLAHVVPDLAAVDSEGYLAFADASIAAWPYVTGNRNTLPAQSTVVVWEPEVGVGYLPNMLAHVWWTRDAGGKRELAYKGAVSAEPFLAMSGQSGS